MPVIIEFRIRQISGGNRIQGGDRRRRVNLIQVRLFMIAGLFLQLEITVLCFFSLFLPVVEIAYFARSFTFHFEHLQNLLYLFVIESAFVLSWLLEKFHSLRWIFGSTITGGRFGLFLFLAGCERFYHIIELLRYNDAIITILEPENHQEYQSL